MAELFISYSRQDRPQALDLAAELRAEGFSVWIDQGGIEGAQNWSAKIVEGIDECSTMVLLISPHSVASRNVAKEVHLAYEKKKHILPVVIEKVKLPASFEYSLAGLQHVYFHNRPGILQSLQLLRAGVPATEEYFASTPPEPPDDNFIRIAVLPFDDLSSAHDNQWFADGMMDELIATLGQLDRVKAPSRSDVLHYREHRVKSKDIARELGVRYLIEGAVRKAGEKIRINATLIDTRQNEQLWGNQFNGTFEDVFAFQESVSKSIVDALKLKLTPQEKERVKEHGTENAEAYALFLRGRHEQDYHTKDSYLRAINLYEQAAALDPKFARAHVGIASACCVYYREYSRDPKWLARAEQNLAEANRVAGEISISLLVRGTIEMLKGNATLAMELLARATALDPKNYGAYNVLGNIHIAHENFPAAVAAFQQVVEIVESAEAYFNLLVALDLAEETEQLVATATRAVPIFDRYLLREPEAYNAAVSRGHVLIWAGRVEEAEVAASRLLENDSLDGQTLHSLGELYDSLGKSKTAIPLWRKAIDRGFRNIEQIRKYALLTTDPESERECKELIQDLERLVAIESTPAPT